MRVIRASFVIAAMVFALVAQPVSATHWSSATFIAGNPRCAEGHKIDPVSDGTFAMDFGGFSGSITIDVTDTPSGPTFSFATDNQFHVITSVVVKGGPNALLYTYSPGVSGDSGLHSPLNPNNGKWYGLSHLCFETVKKSA